MDGDTFYLGRQSVRIADIDTPETHPPRCSHEADLGARATRRLHQLLNAGPFVLESRGRDEDQYGRKLRTVTRDGRSLGVVLVSEGLARRWTGTRRSWCG
jgi:endonuclease YncB( thermonuclease family)